MEKTQRLLAAVLLVAASLEGACTPSRHTARAGSSPSPNVAGHAGFFPYFWGGRRGSNRGGSSDANGGRSSSGEAAGGFGSSHAGEAGG